MLRKLPLKKLVVELRYKPELGFYGKMDPIGLELADEFPDWQRSPLTLEVRNKKKHRRLFLSYNRVFLDVDEADSDGDFSRAEKLLRTVYPKLAVKEFLRIGVRQWFAANLDKPFALMVDEFAERFLVVTLSAFRLFGVSRWRLRPVVLASSSKPAASSTTVTATRSCSRQSSKLSAAVCWKSRTSSVWSTCEASSSTSSSCISLSKSRTP
jgi:hypothetical protein